jgi:hypothetical protein
MRTDEEGPDVILKGGALKDPVKLHFTALDASWPVATQHDVFLPLHSAFMCEMPEQDCGNHEIAGEGE